MTEEWTVDLGSVEQELRVAAWFKMTATEGGLWLDPEDGLTYKFIGGRMLEVCGGCGADVPELSEGGRCEACEAKAVQNG